MIPLQIETALLDFKNYGLPGLIILALGFFAWKLYSQQVKYAEGWRMEAKEMTQNFMDLSSKQNETNNRLIDIREKDVAQNKEFYDDITKKVEAIPERTVRELDYRKLQRSQPSPNNTPAP